MKFEEHFNLIMELLGSGKPNDDGENQNQPEQEQPDAQQGQEQSDSEGDQIDLENPDLGDGAADGSLLDDPDIIGDEENDEEQLKTDAEIIPLVSMLLDVLRFKPSREFLAYINMPKFKTLSDDVRLSIIKGAIAKHPEMIIKEEDESGDAMLGGMDFGMDDGSDESLDNDISYTPKFVKRLIFRSLNVNPHTIKNSLNTLPTEVNRDNYKGIIDIIKTILL